MTLIRYPVIDDSGPEWDITLSANHNATAGPDIVLDTGQLAAGLYQVICVWNRIAQGSNSRLELQHRNSANAANVELQTALGNAGSLITLNRLEFPKSRVAQDERFRVVLTLTGGVGSVWDINLLIRRLNGDI